ncbi:MAG: tetratricopeptide repeat protein [Chthoniobacterales bacterium]
MWLVGLACNWVCALSVSAQTEKAIERYEQVLHANPADGTPLERVWTWYRDRNALDALIERYARVSRNDFANSLILGHLLKRSQRFDEAAAAYRNASELAPSDAMPWRSLADLYAERGKQRDAAEALAKAVLLLPESDTRKIDWQIQLGDFWQSLGELERAKQAWLAATALAPENLDLRSQLAQISEKNHQVGDALVQYRVVAVRGSPYQRATAYREIARLERARNNFDGAAAALEDGIKLTGPSNWLRPDLQSRLIDLYQEAGRGTELERKWIAAVESEPRDLGVLQALVTFYARVGNPDGEEHTLRRIVALAPHQSATKSRLAQLLALRGELNEASDLYDDLILQQPADAEFQFDRARLEIQSGHLTEAEDRITAFLRNHPQDEAVRQQAIDFFTRSKLDQDAERLLEESARLDGDGNTLPLVRFRLQNHQFLAARSVLEHWLKGQSARYCQAASGFREFGFSLEAEALLREAVQLDARNNEAIDALLDIFEARKDVAAVRELVRAAYLSATDSARKTQLDRRVFSLLSSARDPRLSGSSGYGIELRSEELDALITNLERQATTNNDAQSYLRLATWSEWTSDLDGAVRATQKAIALDPKSVDARERLVSLAAEANRSDLAAEELQQLLQMNPSGSVSYNRQLADLAFNRNDLAEGLVYLRKLKSAASLDFESMVALASGFERANRLNEALEVWQLAYAEAAGAQRKEALDLEARLLTRLGQAEKAARLLLAYFDEQVEPAARKTAFDDLLDHCSRNALLNWLEQNIQERKAATPDDYFLQVALAAVLRQAGHEGEAFSLMQKAFFGAPDVPAALRSLVAEAERIGNLTAARDNQRKLCFLSSADDSEPLLKLAALEQADCADARPTWETLITRFPRDSGVLKAAADYFERQGQSDRVAEILQRVIELDPAGVAALHRLGSIYQREGKIEAAEKAFAQAVSASSGLEKENLIERFPRPDDARNTLGVETAFHLGEWSSRSSVEDAVRNFWKDPGQVGETDLDHRLDSVARWVACLRALHPSDWRQLTARTWEGRQRLEPTAALFAYAAIGDYKRILTVTGPLIDASASDPILAQAHLWYALEAGEYRLWRPWLESGTADQRILALAVLGHFLKTRPHDTLPGFVDAVFQGDDALRQMLWDAARVLAASNRFEIAIELGRRALAQTITHPCELAKDIAQWCISIDQFEDAKNILAATISRAKERQTDDYILCLHGYFNLLSQPERRQFAARFLASLRTQEGYNQNAFPAAFICGWAGDMDTAKRLLDQLFSQPAWSGDETWEFIENPGSRSWQYVLNSGRQLIDHQLQALAEHLWLRATSDPALIELEGEQSKAAVRDIRLRLVQIQLARVLPGAAETILDEVQTNVDGAMPNLGILAAQLETAHELRLSVLAYQRQYLSDPDNAEAFRSVIGVMQRAGDPALFESFLRPIVAGERPIPSGIERSEIVLRLAEASEQGGHPARARAFLEEALQAEPTNAQYLQALARLPQTPLREAEELWQRLLASQPDRVDYLQGLANLYSRSGRQADAIKLVAEKDRGSGAVREMESIYGSSVPEELPANPDQLIRQAHAYLRDGAPANVVSIASELRRLGHSNEAIELLRASAGQATDAHAKAFLESQMLTQFLPAPGLDRELDQFSFLAETHPDLRSTFWETLGSLAKKENPGAVGRLREAWKEGNVLAGEVLAGVELSRGNQPAAIQVIDALLKGDALPESALSRLEVTLNQAHLPELAGRVTQELVERDRNELGRYFAWCHDLWAAGDRETVSQILNRLARRSCFHPDLQGRIASFYLAVGQPSLARVALEAALAQDPDQVHPEWRLQYAQLLLDDGNASKARGVLRNTHILRSDAIFKEYFHLVARANLSDEWLGETDYLPQDIGDDLWVSCIDRWEEEGAAGPALAALERRPDIVPRTLKHASRLFADWATAPRASVLFESLLGNVVLERNEAADALQFADALLDSAQRPVALKALAAVERAGDDDLKAEAKKRLNQAH